jgi:glycosyltransferase involved in cell wall biosynthesis
MMPVFNTLEILLRKAINSVRAQLYPHWELCIADDASTVPHVREVLEDLAASDHDDELHPFALHRIAQQADLQQRRLAAAVAPDDAHRLAPPHVE